MHCASSLELLVSSFLDLVAKFFALSDFDYTAMPPIITSDWGHISSHVILEWIKLSYKTIFIHHPYITGFFLIMWSYHPKAPFQALVYLCWTLPKTIAIWMLRQRGFHVGGDAEHVGSDDHSDIIQVDTTFARRYSYGSVNEPPDDTTEQNDQNIYHPVADDVNIWWRVFGMLLYLFGFAVMLVYGTLVKG